MRREILVRSGISCWRKACAACLIYGLASMEFPLLSRALDLVRRLWLIRLPASTDRMLCRAAVEVMMLNLDSQVARRATIVVWASRRTHQLKSHICVGCGVASLKILNLMSQKWLTGMILQYQLSNC